MFSCRVNAGRVFEDRFETLCFTIVITKSFEAVFSKCLGLPSTKVKLATHAGLVQIITAVFETFEPACGHARILKVIISCTDIRTDCLVSMDRGRLKFEYSTH